MTDDAEENIVEVSFDKMAYGGEAMGRLEDGRAVFVGFALPGERARIRVVEEKRGFGRGELVEILEPSPERVSPRCQHFGDCGGCHYQHMSYAAQLGYKADILRDQLERIGKLENVAVQPTVASPKMWEYRNHVQFHLNAEGQLGFQAAGSGRVVPIESCDLMEETLGEIWPQLEVGQIPGLERIGLRQGGDEDVMVVLTGGAPGDIEFGVDIPVAAVHTGGGTRTILADKDHITMEARGRKFRVTADAFFQVNTAMAEIMVGHVLDNLALNGEEVALEVYCGVGLFSAFLAERAGQLIGIEASASACDDFLVNLDEFENVALYEGRAEEALPQIKERVDVVLVDPPRSGLERIVLDAITALEARVLVYVSCDPATLGRDAKRLAAAGYRLRQVTPFDLFPQTYHIESISFWDKEM
ncbi:MAG: class I SAM-dependent RNA methyltransferase [Anaerolineae bacterium]|nr:class I SAM-dependent RNA methyltransferase [Anaerolineae bacterium]